MTRNCEACGSSFDAKRKAARFCSDACRKRVARGQVIAMPAKTNDPADCRVHAATLAELVECEQSESMLGQTALALAMRIDVGNETGAATAALARELRTTMEEAKAAGRRPASPVISLRDEALRRAGMSG